MVSFAGIHAFLVVRGRKIHTILGSLLLPGIHPSTRALAVLLETDQLCNLLITNSARIYLGLLYTSSQLRGGGSKALVSSTGAWSLWDREVPECVTWEVTGSGYLFKGMETQERVSWAFTNTYEIRKYINI